VSDFGTTSLGCGPASAELTLRAPHRRLSRTSALRDQTPRRPLSNAPSSESVSPSRSPRLGAHLPPPQVVVDCTRFQGRLRSLLLIVFISLSTAKPKHAAETNAELIFPLLSPRHSRSSRPPPTRKPTESSSLLKVTRSRPATPRLPRRRPRSTTRTSATWLDSTERAGVAVTL
jgi:hypothetical protein